MQEPPNLQGLVNDIEPSALGESRRSLLTCSIAELSASRRVCTRLRTRRDRRDDSEVRGAKRRVRWGSAEQSQEPGVAGSQCCTSFSTRVDGRTALGERDLSQCDRRYSFVNSNLISRLRNGRGVSVRHDELERSALTLVRVAVAPESLSESPLREGR